MDSNEVFGGGGGGGGTCMITHLYLMACPATSTFDIKKSPIENVL